LVRTLSHELDAEVEWVHGQQGALLQALRHRDLDLVVGGIGGSSPWATQVGFTRPYYTDTIAVGGAPGASPPAEIKHLRVAVVAGEATAEAVRGKGGVPVVVRDLAMTDLPVGAPTWRLAQLRRRPNTALVLLQEPHVLATPPGENAWLVRLEQLLITEQDTVAAILRQLPR
jgi:polar amino acid transport system substrate-binding protein